MYVGEEVEVCVCVWEGREGAGVEQGGCWGCEAVVWLGRLVLGWDGVGCGMGLGRCGGATGLVAWAELPCVCLCAAACL